MRQIAFGVFFLLVLLTGASSFGQGVRAGLGMRAWAKGIMVRIDTAVSNEDFGVQMMVSQPFQF